MQFLSRINDGDNLGKSLNVILHLKCILFYFIHDTSLIAIFYADVTFQKPLTPLESALSVLESICTEMDVAQNLIEQVHTSIREMVRPQYFLKQM